MKYNKGNSFGIKKGEIKELKNKNFIEKGKLERLEDSIEMNFENKGREYSMNGVEIKITDADGISKEHFYLMKIRYKNIKNKIELDLMMKDGSFKKKIKDMIYTLYSVLFFTLIVNVFLFASLEDEKIRTFTLVSINLVILFGFLHYFFKKKKDVIGLQSTPLRKLYNVYCKDQIMSRLILSTDFIERIKEIHSITGRINEFLFKDDAIYIKIFIKKDNFLDLDLDGDIEKSDIINEIKSIIYILETLKLERFYIK